MAENFTEAELVYLDSVRSDQNISYIFEVLILIFRTSSISAISTHSFHRWGNKSIKEKVKI